MKLKKRLTTPMGERIDEKELHCTHENAPVQPKNKKKEKQSIRKKENGFHPKLPENKIEIQILSLEF